MTNQLYFRNRDAESSSEFLGSDWMAKSKWKIGKCTDCGVKGIFWDGGKKEYHYCIKHNLRIKK